MPKRKEPGTLQNLAIEALGRIALSACEKAIDDFGFGRNPEICVSGLQEYIYGNLAPLLSCEVTVHMLSVVTRALKLKIYKSLRHCGNTNRKNILESVIMACVYPEITVLEMYDLPKYAQKVLACNIQTFKKLHTLICSDVLPTDVVETLPVGLSSLKFLVDFRMQCICTDDIIQALGSCCSKTIKHINANYSDKVTDASFKNLIKCHRLKHLLICCTSMTAEGYVLYLKDIQQRQDSDETAEGFLRLGVGSDNGWVVSKRQLNKIAFTCPMLEELEINTLRGDLGALASLTTLEVLDLNDCDFYQCHLDGFLRLRGSNLLSLELSNTDPIDLTCIMNNCINMKKLCVLGGSITDKILEKTRNAAKACRNLEVLDLICWFSTSSIEHMLYACVNVTLLCLMPDQRDITDEFILRFLSKNPLQKLTSFTASSTELTMKSVNEVVEHCASLEELQCIRCSKIKHLEMKCLRQKIADKNQDLRIHFSK